MSVAEVCPAMIIRTTRAGPDTTLALDRETPWGLTTSNMGPGECPWAFLGGGGTMGRLTELWLRLSGFVSAATVSRGRGSQVGIYLYLHGRVSFLHSQFS